MALKGTHSNIEFNDHSEEIIKLLGEAVVKGLEAIGMTAETYAKKECPVDTGRLRNSITHAVETNEKAVYIGTNVEYAPYVELGTSRQKAQPYLRPAAANHGAEYKRIMEAALKSAK